MNKQEKSMVDSSSTEVPPSQMEQEAAAKQVREVGLELNKIKNAMKAISIDRGGDISSEKNENTLKITALKVSKDS